MWRCAMNYGISWALKRASAGCIAILTARYWEDLRCGDLKYRKKPVVVEAIQWTGRNMEAIHEFCTGESTFKRQQEVSWVDVDLYIETLEGRLSPSIGDYIIKGVNGEFYPCKPDIFEKTYEAVE